MDIDTPKFASVAGATAAMAAINTILSGVKRGRDVTEGMSTGGGQATSVDQRPHLHVGGDSMAFRKARGRTKERGGIKSRMQLLIAQQRLLETYVVARFQYLTADGFSNPLENLYYQLDKQTAAGGWQNMPVYAFNLSSLPNMYLPGNAPTVPMYRLQKYIQPTGADDALIHNYQWIFKNGQDRLAPTTLTPYWQVEKVQGIDGSQHPIKQYMYNWSDIEIACKAPDVSATRVHVALVHFNNPAAAPKRYYNGGDSANTPVPYDVDPDQRTCSKADLWYDNFLARKTTHPMRSVDPMEKNQAIKFLSKECICLEPGRTITKGVFSSKIFHTANKLLRCTDAQLAEKFHEPNINTATAGNKPLVVWNLNKQQESTRGFPDRRKDTWLFIYAEDFNPVRAISAPTTPISASFDLKIRSKWTLHGV